MREGVAKFADPQKALLKLIANKRKISGEGDIAAGSSRIVAAPAGRQECGIAVRIWARYDKPYRCDGSIILGRRKRFSAVAKGLYRCAQNCRVLGGDSLGHRFQRTIPDQQLWINHNGCRSLRYVPLRQRQEVEVLLLRSGRRDRKDSPHDRRRAAARRAAARGANARQVSGPGIGARSEGDA